MIHKFSISNFHSVREEVVLDLRIPGTAPDLPRFRRSTAKPDIRLPSVVVLIGPNGSGKSTLLSALVATAFAAHSHHPLRRSDRSKPFSPFGLRKPEMNRRGFAWSSKQNWLGEARQLFRYELAVVCGGNDPFFSYEALSHFPKGRPGAFSSAVPRENLYMFLTNLVLSPGMIASRQFGQTHR